MSLQCSSVCSLTILELCFQHLPTYTPEEYKTARRPVRMALIKPHFRNNFNGTLSLTSFFHEIFADGCFEFTHIYTRHVYRWVMGLKRPGSEDEHSATSSADVRMSGPIPLLPTIPLPLTQTYLYTSVHTLLGNTRVILTTTHAPYLTAVQPFSKQFCLSDRHFLFTVMPKPFRLYDVH